jgi:hypothetical protein
VKTYFTGENPIGRRFGPCGPAAPTCGQYPVLAKMMTPPRFPMLGAFERSRRQHLVAAAQFRKMADRIQPRAIRRFGELLNQIPAGHGARNGKRKDGGVPPFTRTEAAEDAGVSERQRKTALRVANVPVAQFEAARSQLATLASP